MDLKIIEKKEEPLLSRTKIVSGINFDSATPSKKEVKSKLASSLNANENLMVVRNIRTRFGFRKANVTAYIYNDKKEMESIEPKSKKEETSKDKVEGKEAAESKEEKPEQMGKQRREA